MNTNTTAQAVGVHIDRVTQLQDSIDEQCQMLFNSLGYLHRKAGMVQVTPDIPITQQNTNSASAEEFTARTQEIANDICCQAKKIDALVDSLPGVSVSESDQEREFLELSKEDEAATSELEEAGREARALLKEISSTLREIADNAGKQTSSPKAANEVVVSAGYLFPAYKCFKLLRGGPEAIAPSANDTNSKRDVVKGILKYWIVMAGFTAVELVSDVFLFWLPLVGLVKVAFVAWLLLPGINGAEITYDYIVEPYLIQNEQALDGYFQQARAVAHRSTSTASKTAYDRWVGYMQQTINKSGYGASSDSPLQNAENTAGDSDQPNSTGLGGLLKNVSQRVPGASTAADYIASFSGPDSTHTTASQPGNVSKTAGISSMLTSWLASYASGSVAEMPDHQRLQDIRSRKQQLQDMVRQLETSEHNILEMATTNSSSNLGAAGSANNSPNDASEFEDDAVMVNEPTAEEKLEKRKHGDSSNKPGSSTDGKSTQSVSSSTSRRWFW
ncbi:hypothetical protein IW140_001690 [Coemansia sp. RSA 1813]|nr:hypothetical protein LPJ74_001435 [Coemansia sp. RSA 1843]KAJ2090937.1 hypothetical protein IW138_002341 [Coemansia sp. RSA 986]KAJ2213995.1 hypothetical protein EV179_003350 [Coemansia sp. RSA 487]KAJ2571236.1 hypothetical protein IW140_001690 [Coemansia sp. RSA 1813]